MSEPLTVTLTGPAAEAVQDMVSRGEYATPEEAVADAVALLTDETEPFALSDEWIAEARRRMAEHDADPSSAIPIEELTKRLTARLGRNIG